MKILFAATGDIAAPVLKELHSKGLVRAVLTSPDARGKRGKDLIMSPIKSLALSLGLDVYTPTTLKKDFRLEMKALGFDTLVSFCYGKIFGPLFLSLFKYKFNIHPSLLPLYRGPAPIYETIKNSDKKAAISIQDIALNCDEGDIYKVFEFDLCGEETTLSLTNKVSFLAGEMVRDFFPLDEKIIPLKQEGEASYSTFIKKEDGVLNFNNSAKELHSQIRSCNPWPKAICKFKDKDLYLTSVNFSVFGIVDEKCKEEPGTVVSLDKKNGLKIATACGYLYVKTLQLATKKDSDAASFVNGYKDIIGSVLS